MISKSRMRELCSKSRGCGPDYSMMTGEELRETLLIYRDTHPWPLFQHYVESLQKEINRTGISI